MPPRTRRPAGEMLVRGSEDGHEAAGPAGAPRGSGLSPVNKHHPEGLSREETRRSNETSWTLPVLTCRTVWGKDPTASLHTGLRWTGGTKAKPLSQVLYLVCFHVCAGVWSLEHFFVHVTLTLFRCFDVTDDRKNKTKKKKKLFPM